jgi:methyltransferase-like protein/SAM-dependent methyltransferase
VQVAPENEVLPMADQAQQGAYEQVPYPSLSYTQSHPDRLATLATLRGLTPTPIDRCRVLELGCASGGNLIPMAYGLPGSTMLGIDSAENQVAEGQAAIAALGLENVTLAGMDILDVDGELGTFDYIIAHGVFSWVPYPVQEKLLAVCKENLAPNGVAYVSYNAYPGWHMLGIIRDMMLYRTRALSDPHERAAEARALLDFLADSVPPETSAYGSFLNMYARFLQGEIKGAHGRGNAFLLHDELEEVNEPLYFYQFAGRAERHGLQYLGEAEFRTMVDRNFPPQVSERLREMSGSAVELEQYMDFLRNRTFRQTLLCHQDVPLTYTLSPEQLAAFHISSRAQPVGEDLTLLDDAVTQFRAPDGAILSTDHPTTKAAMQCLGEIWPKGLPFDALLAAARSRLAEAGAAVEVEGPLATHDAMVVGTNLLKAYTYSDNLVELHVHEPRMALDLSERPSASAVARLLAGRGTKVTNLRHERVDLDDLDRLLLPYLDGSRDLVALAELLAAHGVMAIGEGGERIEDPDRAREVMVQSVGRRIRWLARAALLIG